MFHLVPRFLSATISQMKARRESNEYLQNLAAKINRKKTNQNAA